jgi:Flp pilus assembly protein TadB
MRVILILFLFCVLTVASFLPVPVTVILCTALVSGLGVTIWVAASRRAARVVIQADANAESGGKSRRKSDRL